MHHGQALDVFLAHDCYAAVFPDRHAGIDVVGLAGRHISMKLLRHDHGVLLGWEDPLRALLGADLLESNNIRELFVAPETSSVSIQDSEIA